MGVRGCIAVIALVLISGCLGGTKLEKSPTGERIAAMAEAWPVQSFGGSVQDWVPTDVVERARAISPVLLHRAEAYPSYVAQLELCGRDGAWVLDDFLQRLDAQNIQGADRALFLRILATGQVFHEGNFRSEARNGFMANNWCENNTPENFKETMENAQVFGSDAPPREEPALDAMAVPDPA